LFFYYPHIQFVNVNVRIVDDRTPVSKTKNTLFQNILQYIKSGCVCGHMNRVQSEIQKQVVACLCIKTAEAKAAIERMLRLGMLERGRGGKLVPATTSYHSPDGVSDASMRRNHAKHLDMALSSLESDPVEAFFGQGNNTIAPARDNCQNGSLKWSEVIMEKSIFLSPRWRFNSEVII